MQPWVSCQVQCTVRSTTLDIPIPAVFASLASLLPRSSRVFLSPSFSLAGASLLSLSLSASSPCFPSAARTCVHACVHARVRTYTLRQKLLYASPSPFHSSPSVPPPRDRCVFLCAAVVGRSRGTGSHLSLS